MNKTSIEWVKNLDGSQGYTWNPITGCLNGCDYCYARKLANGRLKSRYLANTNLAPSQFNTINPSATEIYDPFYPRSWFDRRERALESKNPKGVFVCDMSDLFGIGIPDSWTECVLETIKVCPEHRFYLLTKQPQNLIKFSPFPDNCYVGVSATDNEMAYNASCNLASVKARIEYISFEPLLGRISPAVLELLTDKLGVQWIIIGALTLTLEDYNNSNYALRRGLKLKQWGKKWTVQPEISWVQEITEACDKGGIPVFHKDNLKPIFPGTN